MSIGTVTKYNQLESVLHASANRQWDDATAGSLMWCLADQTYTPSAAHTTTNDVGAALKTSGDGAPMNLTTPAIDAATTPGTTFYNADSANFGTSVNISQKYLICVQPVTAGIFSATTAKLLFYIDLNLASGSALATSIASDFRIDPPVNGWFKSV